MNYPASNHIAAAARCSSYLLGKKTCQVKQDALVPALLHGLLGQRFRECRMIGVHCLGLSEKLSLPILR